jgi:alkylation response protein AidB-like acyl-CoA dehydrogenase
MPEEIEVDEIQSLEHVVESVVAPRATVVDETGTFPREALDALGGAGVLGLCSAAEVGGGGRDLRAAAVVVEQLASVCASTAMVVLMHYAATAAIEAAGPEGTRREIAAGRHLSTLAFSEAGSRSHFWAPLGTAARTGDGIRLDASKSWVTSAKEADTYVWSSRPVGAPGPMTLWLVPRGSQGLTVSGPFDGLGLRGNGSVPVAADGVMVRDDAMLGADGAGLDLALSAVLPWFLVLSGAFSVGIMRAVTQETGAHLRFSRLEHLGQSLAEQPLPRLDHARMQIAVDQAASLLEDTLTALEQGREDALLKVLEVKAAAGESAISVTDLAMKVCGGAAFRKELGIERRFRDARASRVMAPTTDALLDFVGRAINGLPLV